jgi:bacteriorhodopsin
MKFENFLLSGLFALCLLLCVAILGSMLFARPHPQLAHATAHTHNVASIAMLTPMACPLLPDGVLCMRHDG